MGEDLMQNPTAVAILGIIALLIGSIAYRSLATLGVRRGWWHRGTWADDDLARGIRRCADGDADLQVQLSESIAPIASAPLPEALEAMHLHGSVALRQLAAERERGDLAIAMLDASQRRAFELAHAEAMRRRLAARRARVTTAA